MSTTLSGSDSSIALYVVMIGVGRLVECDDCEAQQSGDSVGYVRFGVGTIGYVVARKHTATLGLEVEQNGEGAKGSVVLLEVCQLR